METVDSVSRAERLVFSDTNTLNGVQALVREKEKLCTQRLELGRTWTLA